MSSGGHKTSAIPRPKDATRRARAADRPATTTAARSRLHPADRHGEATGQGPRQARRHRPRGHGHHRCARRRTVRVAGEGLAAPARRHRRQAARTRRRSTRPTPSSPTRSAGCRRPRASKEAAREEIGYVQRGEIRSHACCPPPPAPITMPSGWPYDAVAQIIAVRTTRGRHPRSLAVEPDRSRHSAFRHIRAGTRLVSHPGRRSNHLGVSRGWQHSG